MNSFTSDLHGQQVYLKSNVVIEPLIDQWYAWAHLVSPATAAMNIRHRHLEIMDSYLLAPHVHMEAVKNPRMRGGPFMDIDESRVTEVEQLKARTLANRAQMIAFATAVKELDLLLKEKAVGSSLEPLYECVPAILRGYVELYYDLNNHPSFRFFEALLYRSEFYDARAQSICLWLTNNDSRPFCLSTPRVGEDRKLQLPFAFNDPIIDELSRMKRTPALYDDIRAGCRIEGNQELFFETLFTREKPPVYERYRGERIRMRYFGHACILIETRDVSILVDPLISYYGYQHDVERFSDLDLPDEIDYVLITHNHQDHILFETLLPLRHRIRNLIVPSSTSGALQDPNIKLMFNEIGFQQVIEIDPLESIRFKDCTIMGIPFVGEHCDLGIQAKTCYLVKIGQFSVMFMADSCNMENRLYEHVHKIVGDIDVLFLGMECDGAPLSWLYGPLLHKQISRDNDLSRRLSGSNFRKGKQLVDLFRPKELYVYAMGQEPWVEFITSVKYTPDSNPIVESNKLIDYCKKNGMLAERLYGEKELLRNKYEALEIDPIMEKTI